MKFFFDLFPLLVFFIVFKFWGIFTATATAMGATVLQIIWVAVRKRRVDTMLWVNLMVIILFGGATLTFHNEAFIKWKPTVLYWVFASAMLVAQLSFRKNALKGMLNHKIDLPEKIWQQLNLAWSLFLAVLGALNLVIAYYFSTEMWVNFKLFGSSVLMLIFIVAQGVWLAKYIQEKPKN